ncbi:MAG TPA: AMP-binding protein [Candidatus Dormibacteraeota bacterium]|nr:AMP-binding protein [Candidatus Dormibacteraeota bacterium]
MQQLEVTREVAAARAEIDAEVEGRTLPGVFADTVARLADTEALKWKAGGEWRSLTWRQYRQAVAEVALGLRTLGFGPGQFMVIWSRNRPEPQVADLAALHARGCPVSLYNTLAPDQAAYIAGHCEATVAVVEDRGFLDKLRSVRDQLPHLRHVVILDGDAAPDEGVLTWEEVRAAGQAEAERSPDAFDESWRQVAPDDLATLIYTSGTTGPPKGVMIPQRNVLWLAAANDRVLPQAEGGRSISYLPLAHATGRTVDHWLPIISGGTVHFCPDPTQLFQYAVEVRPTGLVGVPRIWEKLYAGLAAAIAAEPDAERRQLVERAIDARRQVVRLRQQGQEPPPELAAAAERAAPVAKAILARVGLEECEQAVTGAAPIDPAIIEFFQALGLSMTEGWGMTELTCAATITSLDRVRNGTVGYAYPGIEVRIADDGEVLVRGPIVMRGYYKDPEKTTEAIDADDWMHTGDIGTMDAGGYVKIVDRKKELLITAGGKNISPANIEHLLLQHPLIGQACAIGDRRAFVSALLVLDAEMAPVWAKRHGIEPASAAALAGHPGVLAEVQRAVDAANEHLSRAEQVKRFTVLPAEWTPESGELTPTLKMRRRVIVERYGGDIEAMYRAPS